MTLRTRLHALSAELRRNGRYLDYVLTHKRHVFIAGIRLGVPLWALIVHDWTKFMPDEWRPYRDRFYPPSGQTAGGITDALKQFNEATLQHFRRNPHHWQYWMTGSMNGVLEVFPMPERFVREMVADWIGAAKAQGNGRVSLWWKQKRDRMKLDYRTRELVDELIDRVEKENIG